MNRTPDDDRWHDRFDRECKRIISALGNVTEGGRIEQLEHVGATSVTALLGRPCVDIALAVWPFPLDEPAQQSLGGLGYELVCDFAADSAGGTEQRFRHVSAARRLYVVEAGSPLWTDFVLLREHLRHDAAAREALSARKREWEGRADSTDVP